MGSEMCIRDRALGAWLLLPPVRETKAARRVYIHVYVYTYMCIYIHSPFCWNCDDAFDCWVSPNFEIGPGSIACLREGCFMWRHVFALKNTKQLETSQWIPLAAKWYLVAVFLGFSKLWARATISSKLVDFRCWLDDLSIYCWRVFWISAA